jgi:radical SAM superfamily enzyme with C-terminal helix-hairpin-helix motif
MGCFVDYSYFSAVPPRSDEVYRYLLGTKARKILFYVLGIPNLPNVDYDSSRLSTILDHVEYGNTYRYILEDAISNTSLAEPNYQLLDSIAGVEPPLLSQLRFPIIAEIETGSGCNTATCSFCIECARPQVPTYRRADSITKQVSTLYRAGVRHFRLGRQPNFYHFAHQNVEEMRRLLASIRDQCPDLETLHIDNVNAVSVLTAEGTEITKLIVRYCTSGNVAPLGIESFDPVVRAAIRKPGTAGQVMQAIEIINEYGAARGDDGFPKFLPGINLIYGLPGQTDDTHRINLEYLGRILANGWSTRRLFFRRQTGPSGVSFAQAAAATSSENYRVWHDEVVRDYVLPMQSRVYPESVVLRGFREVIAKGGDSYIRTLGTCSIRVVVPGATLEPYQRHDVRIIANRGYRLLQGELTSTMNHL